MSLAQLVQRARAAHQHGAGPAKVLLWLDTGKDADATIAAERAAGRIGLATEVTLVTWRPVDSETALPANS